MADRVKFATQLNEDLLNEVKTLAQTDGRQIQSVIEEALLDLLDKRRKAAARPHVMRQYEKSVEKFAPLYERLAK